MSVSDEESSPDGSVPTLPVSDDESSPDGSLPTLPVSNPARATAYSLPLIQRRTYTPGMRILVRFVCFSDARKLSDWLHDQSKAAPTTVKRGLLSSLSHWFPRRRRAQPFFDTAAELQHLIIFRRTVQRPADLDPYWRLFYETPPSLRSLTTPDELTLRPSPWTERGPSLLTTIYFFALPFTVAYFPVALTTTILFHRRYIRLYHPNKEKGRPDWMFHDSPEMISDVVGNLRLILLGISFFGLRPVDTVRLLQRTFQQPVKVWVWIRRPSIRKSMALYRKLRNFAALPQMGHLRCLTCYDPGALFWTEMTTRNLAPQLEELYLEVFESMIGLLLFGSGLEANQGLSVGP